MSKTEKPANSGTVIEDRTEAPVAEVVKVESVETDNGNGTIIETFVGVQPGVNFAGNEPVAPIPADGASA